MIDFFLMGRDFMERQPFEFWMSFFTVVLTVCTSLLTWSTYRHMSRLNLKEASRSTAKCPSGLLVDLLMPPDRAEDILYNLLGRYDYWVAGHGQRWARVIFFIQSIGAVLTFWSDWALKRLKLLKLWVSN
jgi:hypothetical protein